MCFNGLPPFLLHQQLTPFCLLCSLPSSISPPHLQPVLMGSSGGGPWQRRSLCVRGAARTSTPRLLSTAVAPRRAAYAGRGFTGTQRVCVSSQPSAPALTRASCGRYVHARGSRHLMPSEAGSLYPLCPSHYVVCLKRTVSMVITFHPIDSYCVIYS